MPRTDAVADIPLQEITNKEIRRTARRERPQEDLHERLDKFLEFPTNTFHLKSLISGLVGYELRARLASLPLPEDGCVTEPEHAPE